MDCACSQWRLPGILCATVWHGGWRALKVLIAGAGGMVGQAIKELCDSRGDEVFAYDHSTLDITSLANVETEVSSTGPDAVINCAAWTDVDGCERDPAKSDAANAVGPENLAKASYKVGAALVTISTDYVFDGSKEGFYTQEDEPRPISVYGRSKLQGERRSQLANPGAMIVRSGFIFGPGGRNFLSTIAQPLRRGEQIKAIADAWGTPTYALHLAARLRELAEVNLPGVYHVVNEGDGVTYEEFARAVVEEILGDQSQVSPILSATLNRPAPRPRNSRLKCLMSPKVGLSPLPDWRDALRHFCNPI